MLDHLFTIMAAVAIVYAIKWGREADLAYRQTQKSQQERIARAKAHYDTYGF